MLCESANRLGITEYLISVNHYLISGGGGGHFEHQTILFDLEILLQTIPAVLRGKGAY